jgi:hypothetical protein
MENNHISDAVPQDIQSTYTPEPLPLVSWWRVGLEMVVVIGLGMGVLWGLIALFAS